jgi:hypothetical protein
MTTKRIPFGFRVLDDATETRRLVNAAAAFSAQAADDPKAETLRTCYLSAFQYGDEFRDYLEAHDTTKGFDGLCGGRWLWFDIDRSDIGNALHDARRLAAFIVERYSIDENVLLLFFSGSKGFHVGLPLSLCGQPEPSREFNHVCRRLAETLADAAGLTIDSGVFDKVRLFRAPNSRHQKTGLRKLWLTYDELLNLKIERIVDLARAPLAFDVPDDPPENETARQDWQDAVVDLQQRMVAVADRRKRSSGSGRLNQATLSFIREGAAHGDRHRALFAAAANLAEFDCPPGLAHELLKEAGLDSGLPPGDVRRQIDCGLAHGSQNAAGEPNVTNPNDPTDCESNSQANAVEQESETDPELMTALSNLWNSARNGGTP